MAKNKEETALTNSPGVNLGKLENDAAFAEFIGTGFASIETLIFGDEEEGKTPRYVGVLVGQGAPIERTDETTGEVRQQKTFAFHPMTKLANGEIGTAENVTHVIPASYMLAAACDRILAEAIKNNKKAVVGMLYRGQVKTRRGFRVNDIAVFEKYI